MVACSAYQKHVDGDATVFNVTPASMPKLMVVIVLGAFTCLIGLVLPYRPIGIGLVLLGAIAMAFGWKYDPRPKAFRTTSTFRVTPEAIEAGGHTFARDDIDRLLLRNGMTDQELRMGTTEQPPDLEHRARAARIGNGLALESGGKSTLLAGGMDETTAHGLLHETCAVLGINVD